jgi:hypothetical protein
MGQGVPFLLPPGPFAFSENAIEPSASERYCCWCRLSLLSCRRECPAPTTAPLAAFPPMAPPITAPFAAPLALGWALCCCGAGACCGAGVCCEAGGAAGGGVCADARGTTAVVMDSAIANDIIFVERFIWPPLRLPPVCNTTVEAGGLYSL